MTHFIDDQNHMAPSEVVELLTEAYWAEIETAMNYTALVNNLKGIENDVLKGHLREEIEEEFGHAQRLADRIRVLGYDVPTSLEFKPGLSQAQQDLMSARSPRDVAFAVQAAEMEAIALYRRIISLTAETDPVTADLITELLADEENHFRTFKNLV